MLFSLAVALPSLALAATLPEALTAADDHAAELVAIDADAEAARARVGQARAALLPKLALSGSYTWNDEAVALDLGSYLPDTVIALTGPVDPIEVQPQAWRQGSATLLVPLVDLDDIATLTAARRAAEASGEGAAWARTQLRVGVARAFYGGVLAREGRALAAVALEVATRQAGVAKARVEAGAAPPLEALAAEADRQAAERDVAAAEAAEVQAMQSLWRFTGYPSMEPLTTGVLPPLPSTVEEAVQTALAGRPDLASARAQARAARAASSAAELRWAPDVNGRVTGVLTGNQGFGDDPGMAIGVIEATWTLDGGYTPARVREAGAREAQAAAAVVAAARQVEAEVRSAWAERTRSERATAAAGRQEEAARAAFAQAEAAYAAGAVPWMELERATLGLRAAQRAVLVERVNADLATIGVLAAIGGW